jgi:hypothetical protein
MAHVEPGKSISPSTDMEDMTSTATGGSVTLVLAVVLPRRRRGQL